MVPYLYKPKSVSNWVMKVHHWSAVCWSFPAEYCSLKMNRHGCKVHSITSDSMSNHGSKLTAFLTYLLLIRRSRKHVQLSLPFHSPSNLPSTHLYLQRTAKIKSCKNRSGTCLFIFTEVKAVWQQGDQTKSVLLCNHSVQKCSETCGNTPLTLETTSFFGNWHRIFINIFHLYLCWMNFTLAYNLAKITVQTYI